MMPREIFERGGPPPKKKMSLLKFFGIVIVVLLGVLTVLPWLGIRSLEDVRTALDDAGLFSEESGKSEVSSTAVPTQIPTIVPSPVSAAPAPTDSVQSDDTSPPTPELTLTDVPTDTSVTVTAPTPPVSSANTPTSYVVESQEVV